MTAVGRIAWGTIVWMSLAPLGAGTIEGRVTDDREGPVADVVIWLQADGRDEQMTRTDEMGFYRFDMLAEGWYTLGLVEPECHSLVAPACGYHRIYARDSENVSADRHARDSENVSADFVFDDVTGANCISGAVVKFGSPKGGKEATISEFTKTTVISIDDDFTFSVGVYASNLASSAPDRIVIRGVWHVPGFGTLDVRHAEGKPSEAYPDMGIHFRSLVGNSIEIELSGQPDFDEDGMLATLTFQVDTSGVAVLFAGNKIGFCMDVVSMYRHTNLLQSSPDYFLGTIRDTSLLEH